MASQTWVQAVAFTMLLAKIAVGACPDGYELKLGTADNYLVSECISNSTGESLVPTSEQNITSKEFMCHPAEGNAQCCRAFFVPNSLNNSDVQSYFKCTDYPAGSWTFNNQGEGYFNCNQTDPFIIENIEIPGIKFSSVFCGDNPNITRPTPLDESITCPPNFVLSYVALFSPGSICAPLSGTGNSPFLDPSVVPSKEMFCAHASTEHTCCFAENESFPVIQNGTSLRRFFCVSKNYIDANIPGHPYCATREPMLQTENLNIPWNVDCSLEAPDAEDDSGLSTGAIAGISVGAVAGVALIGTAAYFALKEKAGKPFSL